MPSPLEQPMLLDQQLMKATGAGTGRIGRGKEPCNPESTSTEDAVSPDELPRWKQKDILQNWVHAETLTRRRMHPALQQAVFPGRALDESHGHWHSREAAANKANNHLHRRHAGRAGSHQKTIQSLLCATDALKASAASSLPASLSGNRRHTRQQWSNR